MLCVQEQLFRCQAVADLRKSLQAERDAVFDFLFTAVDDVRVHLILAAALV